MKRIPGTGWTCRRQQGGKKCRFSNQPRTRKCAKCGKSRPVRKKPAHMQALKFSYEYYVELNGGSEDCGICGKPKPANRRHHRDHKHQGDGIPRGILCWRCNNALADWVDSAWCRLAALYLLDSEKRKD